MSFKKVNIEELITYILYDSNLSNEQLGHCTVPEIIDMIDNLILQVRGNNFEK